MQLITYLASTAILYFMLVIFWRGKKELKLLGHYKGMVALSFIAFMGISGGAIFRFQKDILIEIGFSDKLSFLYSGLIMLVIAVTLFYVFVRRNKPQSI